jgi:hypothetical protein
MFTIKECNDEKHTIQNLLEEEEKGDETILDLGLIRAVFHSNEFASADSVCYKDQVAS